MLVLDQIKEQINVMLNPRKSSPGSIGKALRYYFLLSIIPFVLSVVIGAIVNRSIIPPVIGSVLSYFILGPIVIFIISALLQFIGGSLFNTFSGGYKETFRATVYAYSTLLLASWLSPVSYKVDIILLLVFGIWGFIVHVISVSKLQKAKIKSTFWAILLTDIIIFILFVFIGLIIGISLLGSSLGA